MKTVSVRDLQKHVKESLDAAQAGKVVITRKGKPAAILIGVEGEDWETVVLQTNAPFWRLLEKRRRQKTVSFEQMKEMIGKNLKD
jgi:prevent-host-death family protein